MVSTVNYISITQSQQEIVVYAIDFSQAVTDGDIDNLAELLGMSDGVVIDSFKTQYNSAQIYYTKLVTDFKAMRIIINPYLVFLLSKEFVLKSTLHYKLED